MDMQPLVLLRSGPYKATNDRGMLYGDMNRTRYDIAYMQALRFIILHTNAMANMQYCCCVAAMLHGCAAFA